MIAADGDAAATSSLALGSIALLGSAGMLSFYQPAGVGRARLLPRRLSDPRFWQFVARLDSVIRDTAGSPSALLALLRLVIMVLSTIARASSR